MARYDDYNNSNSPFLTFIIGAIAGAVTVMLLDKDIRTKVETKLQDIKSMGEDQIEKVKNTAFETRDSLEDKVEEKLAETQEKIEESRANRESKPARRNSK